MQHYKNQAAAAYKNKEYDSALQLYTKAISCAESAQLYDARAACYEKLKNFDAALKDAKQCIQIAKVDPIGYIRAGHVLVKMNKGQVALEVMSHGLKKVKHAGQGFETLRQAHNDLMAKIMPTTNLDPMTVLPPEIADLVLQHLNFRQLINASSVSKSWHSFIYRNTNLWEHLDFSHARRKVKHKFIVSAIKAAGSKIKKATLHRLWDFDKSFQLLARHCPLEVLIFQDVPRLTAASTDILAVATSLKEFHAGEIASSVVLNICKSRQVTALSCTARLPAELPATAWDALCNLDLVIASLNDWEAFHRCKTAASFRGLESLRLSTPNGALGGMIFGFPLGMIPAWPLDLQDHTRLRDLELCLPQASFEPLVIPSTLRSLKLRTGLVSTLHNASTFPDLWTPTLHTLDLSVTNSNNISTYLLILDHHVEHAGVLDYLALRHCNFTDMCADDPQLDFLLRDARLHKLRHLGLPGAMGWDDALARTISKHLPLLESLDLSSTCITGVGLNTLVQGAKHLKTVNLDMCSHINRDAIDWTRSRGIRVSHRQVEAVQHERRVAY